jgi:p38 MAP kinase
MKAIDLIDKLLVFDPTQRITCEEALAHPYFAEPINFHDVDDEPSGAPFDDSFESKQFTLDEWKSKTFQIKFIFLPINSLVFHI